MQLFNSVTVKIALVIAARTLRSFICWQVLLSYIERIVVVHLWTESGVTELFDSIEGCGQICVVFLERMHGGACSC